MCQINEIQFGIYVEIGTKMNHLYQEMPQKKIFTKDKRQHLTLKSLTKKFPSKQERLFLEHDIGPTAMKNTGYPANNKLKIA